MNLSDECALSYYAPVAEICPEHGVQLVQHTETRRFYVKKRLAIYNLEIFRYLQAHPVRHIPHIYELAEDGNTLIVIEEYLPGQSLQEVLDASGPLPEEQVIELARQLCAIIGQLHSAEPAIIHRDIKPANLILSPDGVLKLLDMNAAKWESTDKTQDTQLIGTTGYAAPEQYGFGVSTVQTDIYSIGVLLNVLLTGMLPAEALAEGALAPIISRCTQLAPEERYASVKELANALSSSPTAAPGSLGAASNPPLGWRRFLPPGFRTLSPVKMLLSLLGYGILFSVSLTLEVEGASPAVLAFERGFFTLIFLSMVFFTGNYLDIQSRFPLANSAKRALRLLGILLWNILLFSVGIFLIAILESLFF